MNHGPHIIGEIQDLKTSAEKANVMTPEIDKFIQEGSERLQAKIAAKQKLTKKDFAFMEKAKAMVEVERFLRHTLRSRFEAHPERHKGIAWPEVENTLRANPEAMASLAKMEETGGEPDVVGTQGDEFVFEDRSAESPSGRRGLTFDEADAQRKSFGPNVRFQSPDSYEAMQKQGEFDLNSWSLLETDAKTREAGRVMEGGRGDDVVGVSERDADYRFPYEGWRATLRVKKA